MVCLPPKLGPEGLVEASILTTATEKAAQKTKEAAGLSSGEAKGKAHELAGEAKGKAHEVIPSFLRFITASILTAS